MYTIKYLNDRYKQTGKAVIVRHGHLIGFGELL